MRRIHAEKHGFRPGASLVETAIGLLTFAIVVLGSANYRYLTAIGTRDANRQLAGADLAVMLLGAWQGIGGSDSYGPDNRFSSHLSISPVTGGTPPDGYNLLGTYDVVVGGQTYRSTLYWKDIASDLRELGVAVSWPLGDGQQHNTFQLTGYARM
jgi:Tfp pilus assembly protein PilV